MIPAAADQDMGIVAATVLASGLFVEGEGQKEALGRIEDADERQRAIGVLEKLSAVEGTLPQKAFRYALADMRISSVSSGATDPEQLEEVAQAVDMGPLSREEVDSLAMG